MSETEVILPEERLIDIAKRMFGTAIRRRWWILSATFIVPLTAIGVLMSMPNTYTSEATLVVVQQQVSQRYVDPANTTSPAELLKSMVREVLSRGRLLGIIEAFGLYPESKKQLGPDRLAERMRRDIEVTPLDQLSDRNDFGAFMISFKADNPRLAQEVTSRLTSLFIEENLKTQGSQATKTTKFLSEQLAAAKQRLDQQDQRLRDFKMRNLGELPEQEQANLGTITDLRIQLQNSMANASRAQQQRITLESTISGNLARLQSERSALLARLTTKHPEVVKLDRQIERSQALLNRLKTGAAGAPLSDDPGVGDDPVFAQLKGQVEALAMDTDSHGREEQRLRAEIAQYQGRLRLTPVREQQLAGILRDYELYKQDYTDLLNRQLRSQLTSNMEQQQAGQHFRLIDPPTLPVTPSSPQRLKFSVLALGAGAGLGIMLALFMDARNRFFYSEKEVQLRFNPPLLVGMPLVRTTREERQRYWRLAFEWVAACAVVAIVLAAELYVYKRG